MDLLAWCRAVGTGQYIAAPVSGPRADCSANGLEALAIMQSVVRIRLAMEAAFCRANRVTLAGSITPICSKSPYARVAAL